MKRSAAFLLFVTLIAALIDRPVLAASPLTVILNGSVVNAPADINVEEGQVMIPLRWAAELLGDNKVQWDIATHTITIQTKQDFYNLEKLASYTWGLQYGFDNQEGSIWPLPERVTNLDLSDLVPNREWALELPQRRKQLSPSQLPQSITIRIVSEDNCYEHSSVVYSAENRHGHYYLPMDWLEYLFKAQVHYNQTANVLSIQTPDLEKIKCEIARIEDILVPESSDEAVKLWGRGEQTRNGALQYAALSPQLRREADHSAYVRQTYWVTGSSSPWVGTITIKNKEKLSDSKILYTLSFPEITSSPPYDTATEKLVVEKLQTNGREGWYITQILQSSGYGILD